MSSERYELQMNGIAWNFFANMKKMIIVSKLDNL